MVLIIILTLFVAVQSAVVKDAYKNQFCTDPRTMKKHEAYTEWADAYSCTRHRCQPGGRNLAIYTVGCKRVEAPESAIECEEVVEDTNMQFPFCCTRLRCLVVVRGEVWTRVLGQPWETLPAAPWSHMYKMKKPPPGDGLTPKAGNEGPIYELTTDLESDGPREKVLRSAKKTTTELPEFNEVQPRNIPVPDIVIALTTNSEQKEHLEELKRNPDRSEERHKRPRKSSHKTKHYEEETPETRNDVENEEPSTEKPVEISEEKYYSNAYGVTQKIPFKAQQQVGWTEIPQNQWNEHDPSLDQEITHKDNYHQPDFSPPETEKKEEKPTNLQALVDAIGTRMRDIEHVVQRMSEKVHQVKPGEPDTSSEKRTASDIEVQSHKHHKGDANEHSKEYKAKKPSPDNDHYKRFSVRNRGSKYLHGIPDTTTEVPLFVEDNNMNGYFSDASNSVLRRANPPKEPAVTYMAPVDNRRKSHSAVSDASEEVEKKRKKHSHKKKRGKGKSHKKHHGKDDKRKRFRVNSAELDRNVVSLEDSSAVVGN